MTNAAQASIRATLLISMMMTISFHLRETSRRKRMLLFPGRALVPDDFRQAQQFGTDLQPRLIGCVQVDFKLHPVSAVEKIVHSAVEGKRVRLDHGNDVRALERLEDKGHMYLYGRVE